PLLKFCDTYEVDLIFLVAPTTTEKRILKILDVASGFIYVVSLLGVTGAREKLSDKIGGVVRRIRKFNEDIPLAVGFGISKPEHIRQVCEIADGGIVGSAFIKIIEGNLADEERMLKALEDFSRSLKRETRNVQKF
ncbi:MAG: tryptophan synthase subunit alpha, partial [Candidatus Methanospirareceae archaeon]